MSILVGIQAESTSIPTQSQRTRLVYCKTLRANTTIATENCRPLHQVLVKRIFYLASPVYRKRANPQTKGPARLVVLTHLVLPSKHTTSYTLTTIVELHSNCQHRLAL